MGIRLSKYWKSLFPNKEGMEPILSSRRYLDPDPDPCIAYRIQNWTYVCFDPRIRIKDSHLNVYRYRF